MGFFNWFFKKETVEEKVVEKAPEKKTIVEEKVEVKTPLQPEIPLSSNQSVITPTSFEDLQKVIILMRDKRIPALINLSTLDNATAQRFIDILSGATTALDGVITKIQPNLYYFTLKN